MPHDSNDVLSIREWLAKESHLEQNFDDLMIKKFLHSCYGSLERTKKCIERFCNTRSVLAEIYTNRDPLSPQLETAFAITNVGTYIAGDDEILIHKLDDPGLEKFVFYDILKTFTIQGDHWLQVHDFYPEGHILILDMTCISLKIIPKVNVLFFRDFIVFLLEGVPVRVKEVHLINCPAYYDRLYGLVKPVLPIEIRNIIHFHTTYDTLHKAIDKKYLPEDYGGDAQSLHDQQVFWVNEIKKQREVFLDDNRWKSDLKKKPRGSVVENTMNGSFRTLSID